MPSASTWVRGQGNTTEQTATTNATKPEPAPTGARFQAQQFSPQHAPKKRRIAASGTWKPGTSQALPIKRVRPAHADAKKTRGSNAHPPRTSAKCNKDAEAEKIKKQIQQKLEEMEAIKRRRRHLEAQQVLKAASALQKEQEELKHAREEAASIAEAMEVSEKLRKRRQQFEVEHEEELRVEKEKRASRAKQIENEVEQRKLISHVLKQHSSLYDVLLIPETSSSGDISKAWKRLSKMVHPDRCKLARADEAFIKIKAAVDALQSTTA
eukprot:jgi/Ulvmu1/1409/UM011_0138.1